jgi:hypothetical protein
MFGGYAYEWKRNESLMTMIYVTTPSIAML